MMHIPSPPRGFASDNNAGVCPEVLAAIADANRGHAHGYGDDPWTEAACARIRAEFGRPDAEVFFVLNGTGANVFALGLVAGAGKTVLCARGAHIEEDETGAPEAILGCKILALEGWGGKIAQDALRAALGTIGNIHAAQPACLSLTQPTEHGELYTLDEVRQLADIAHAAGLTLHMDGARLANAAAALKVSLAATSCDLGVDILSFGAMKDGLAFGEAVVVFRPDLAREAPYLRKARLQLNSKMRFVAAQYLAWLDSGAWKRNADHANAMAALLAAGLASLPGVKVVNTVRTNAVFACIAPEIASELRKDFFFYDMEPGLSRFMTSFDTTASDIELLLTKLKALLY